MRQNYEPKAFLRGIIDTALASEGVDPDNAVIAVGKFGERGVAFYPYDSKGDPSAKVGFSLLARGTKAQHTNLSRDDAMDLVDLLITEYGMSVRTETVKTVYVW